MRYYEQIVLPIINDGNGSICGRTYDERCAIAREMAGNVSYKTSTCYIAAKWLNTVITTVNRLRHADQLDEIPSAQDVLKAALEVADHYAEHVKELA